jgi:RNA polymerase sigma-70 factor (ECF subfamily)
MESPIQNLNEVSDEDLIALAQQRNEAAFTELMRRNSNSSFRLALSILKDTQDAEDEVQNSYLSAWRSIERFKGESRFSTWMTRIVTNQCLMRLRSLRRSKIVYMDHDKAGQDQQPLMQLADQTDSVELTLGNTELSGVVRREIAKLPPLLRDVLVLRDLDLLPTEEVANRLGISAAAVKSRALRARAELRERMERAMATRRPQVCEPAH